MRTVTLREHEAVSVGDDPTVNQFTIREIESLDRAQKAVNAEAFRWTSRNKIKAAQYVGMVAAADIRLEVLPKVGFGLGETRKTLVEMIAIAWDVPISDGEITGHDFQDRDLLELLIGLFARRLQKQVRVGLSRSYRRQEDDLSRLRGKLITTRQFTKLAASPQKLACRYDEFTADTDLNRLLLCAVNFLRRRSVRSDTQRLLSEIAMHFEDVKSIEPSEALNTTITFDRAINRWKISETLARLLLSAIYQTLHEGKKEGVALLFDMNLLFESYIAHLARKICIPLGYRVHTQGPQKCLARNEQGAGAFLTKPDIYVERDGNILILDTKWKHIDLSRRNFDVAQADAYQMHGYARVYASRAAILIYPHHNGMAGQPGLQALWSFEHGGGDLKVATIDVTKPNDFADTFSGLLEKNFHTNT